MQPYFRLIQMQPGASSAVVFAAAISTHGVEVAVGVALQGPRGHPRRRNGLGQNSAGMRLHGLTPVRFSLLSYAQRLLL